MPFDQAKQHFETQTSEAPSKVEEGFAAFRSSAVNYFGKKQKMVASFVDDLNYPGKENDESTYNSTMAKALDNLIDGDEVTKKEMVQYRVLLKKKSVQLKNKLFYEKKKMEIRKVKGELSGVGKSFGHHNLKVNLKASAKAYLSVPKNERIDLKTIDLKMRKLLGAATIMAPDDVKKNYKNILYTAFNHYCLGNTKAAEKEAGKVKARVNIYEQHQQTLNKTDLLLDMPDFENVAAVLIQTGVKPKGLAQFIKQNVDKLSKISGDNFRKLVNGMKSKDLSVFLINMILELKDGKRGIDKIKIGLAIEQKLKGKEGAIRAQLKKTQQNAEKTQDKVIAHQRDMQSKELVIYDKKEDFERRVRDAKRKNNGRLSATDYKYVEKETKKFKTMESKLQVFNIMQGRSLQAEMTENTYNIVSGQSDLLKIDIKRSIISGYLNKPKLQLNGKKTLNAIKYIMNLEDGGSLKSIAEDKEFNAPKAAAKSNLLQALTLRADTLKIEVEKNKWLTKNAEKHGEIKKALEAFYANSKLSKNSKALLKDQFNQHGDLLKETLGNSATIEQDEAKKFQSLKSKHASIQEMPKAEMAKSFLQLQGYSQILMQMRSTTIKYIGQLESSLVLADSHEKSDIKIKIKASRARVMYFANQIHSVDKFCGTDKGKKYADLKNINGSLESPLLGPVISKELIPYTSKMMKQDQSVSEAFGPMNTLGNRLQKNLSAHPRNWSMYFNNAVGEMVGVRSTLEKIRGNRILLQAEVLIAIKSKSNPNGLPEGLLAKKQQYLKKFLKQIEETLYSEKSAISIASIKKVDDGIGKLQDSKVKYRDNKFKTGIIQTAIMAVSIVAAVGGGFAAAALASKIGMVTTIGTVGLSAVGTAGGQVLGQAVTMSAFQASGFYDFGGHGKIWNAKKLGKDFLRSYLLSLAIIGVGKGVSSTLKSWAKKPDFLWRARFANKSLATLKNIKGSLTGTKGLQAGLMNGKETAWQKFWMEVGEESIEEGTETFAEQIDPRFGLVVSILNASDGSNVDTITNVADVKLDLKIENGQMAYTTNTAVDFVKQLNNELGPRLAKVNAGNNIESSFNTSIDVKTGVVTVFMTKNKVDFKTGKKTQISYNVQKIHPGINSVHVTPQTEAAQIDNVVETGKSEYKVLDKHAGKTLAQFQGKGFLVLPNETGSGFMVVKGDTSINVQIEKSKTTLEKANAFFKKNADSLQKTLKIEKYRNAWKSFAQECNGSYETFLQKHPRLAQHLPTNLKDAMIKVSVAGIAVATGMPLVMGFVSKKLTIEQSTKARNLSAKLHQAGLTQFEAKVFNKINQRNFPAAIKQANQILEVYGNLNAQVVALNKLNPQKAALIREHAIQNMGSFGIQEIYATTLTAHKMVQQETVIKQTSTLVEDYTFAKRSGNTEQSGKFLMQIKNAFKNNFSDAELQNHLAKLETAPLDKGKLQEILNQKDFNPKDLITELSRVFPEIYHADSGVSQGYTIGEHTEMVMNQFEKYFGHKKQLPGNFNKSMFRFVLALHDAGKPKAIQSGGKHLQHEYTPKVINTIFDGLKLPPKYKKAAIALMSADPIGEFFQGKLCEKVAVEKINEMAQAAGMKPYDFINLLEVFYKSDAGSYTSNAGGKEGALDALFKFDEANKNVEFSPMFKEGISKLKAKLQKETTNEGNVSAKIFVNEKIQDVKIREEFMKDGVKYIKYLNSKTQKESTVTMQDWMGKITPLRKLESLCRKLKKIQVLDNVALDLLSQDSDISLDQRVETARSFLKEYQKIQFFQNKINELTPRLNQDVRDHIDAVVVAIDFATFKDNKLHNLKETSHSLAGIFIKSVQSRGMILNTEQQQEIMRTISSVDYTNVMSKVTKFSDVSKKKISASIDKRIESVKNSKTLSDKIKKQEIHSLTDLKEIINDGHFGTDLHHGTNAYIWKGLKNNAELLSSAEMVRRGIKIRSGEQDLAGGSADQDMISAGIGLDGLGTAYSYAKANEKVEGYKNPIFLDVPTIKKRIQQFTKALDHMIEHNIEENQALNLRRPIFVRLIREYKFALKKKAKLSNTELQRPPYGLILAFKGGADMEITEMGDREHGGTLSGEVTIDEKLVSLKDNLRAVYVPYKHIQHAKKRLTEMLGAEKAKTIKVYSTGALEYMKSYAGPKNAFKTTYDTTYELLSQQTDVLIGKTKLMMGEKF